MRHDDSWPSPILLAAQKASKVRGFTKPGNGRGQAESLAPVAEGLSARLLPFKCPMCPLPLSPRADDALVGQGHEAAGRTTQAPGVEKDGRQTARPDTSELGGH